MNLTNLQCKNASSKQKPYKLSAGRGLYLEIMPNGSKYWRMKYRVNGKEKRLALGVYPEVSLKDADNKCTSPLHFFLTKLFWLYPANVR